MLTSIFIAVMSAGAFISGFVNQEPGGRRSNEKARQIGSAVEEARRLGKATPHDGDAPVQTPKNEREARHEASKARVRFVNVETGEVVA